MRFLIFLFLLTSCGPERFWYSEVWRDCKPGWTLGWTIQGVSKSVCIVPKPYVSPGMKAAYANVGATMRCFRNTNKPGDITNCVDSNLSEMRRIEKSFGYDKFFKEGE